MRDGRGHGWRERGSGEQPMQGGIRQAKQSTKPVPPAPVAGDPQMKRIDPLYLCEASCPMEKTDVARGQKKKT